MHIVSVLILAALRTYLTNRLAMLQGTLFKTAFLRNVPAFQRALVENVTLCFFNSGLEATHRALLSWVELLWRRSLTEGLHKNYFGNMMYYTLSYVDGQVSQPDQRICDDPRQLATGLAGVVGEVTRAAVDAIFYTIAMRRHTGTHKYALGILTYVLGAGVLTTSLAPNFGKLTRKQQELEGTYRSLHANLAANAESIALFRGAAAEGGLIRDAFARLTHHVRRLHHLQWSFGMVQDFALRYLGATWAVVLIIGPFFGGKLMHDNTVEGRAEMLRGMRYHTSVVVALFQAIGTIASASRNVAKLSGYAGRIAELSDRMATLQERKPSQDSGHSGVLTESSGAIEFKGVCVVTPANQVLIQQLNLRVTQGTNLLVTGPNGSGKSSLFRVLGGLWPLAAGHVSKPGVDRDGGLSHDIFYVPQKPYVMPGSLREQLVYPLPVDNAGGRQLSDEAMRQLLEAVDLGSLVQRHGLDTHVDWSRELSLGEMQRLGMARLFYHSPRFAILDECTSGVTIDMEARFCNTLRAMGCTAITISHRASMLGFHDTVLALDGEGGYQLENIASKRAVGGAAGGASPDRGGGAASSASDTSDVNGGYVRVPQAADSGPPGSGGAGLSERRGGAEEQGGQQQQSQGVKATEAHGEAHLQRQVDAAACFELMKSQAATAPPAAFSGPQSLVATAPGCDPHTEEQLAQTRAKFREVLLQSTRASGRAKWDAVLSLMMPKGEAQVQRMVVIAAVITCRTMLQDRIARLNGATVEHVLQNDLPAFTRLVGVSVLQSVGSAILAPTLKMVTDSLALTWRERLTRALLQRYFASGGFYTCPNLAACTDADARLTDDTARLCNDMAQLLPSLVKPILDVVWFSGQMARLTGVRGVGIAYLYMLLGWGTLRGVTPDFGRLQAKEMELEGRFRARHQYLQAHAEQVAFFGGGGKEGGSIGALFRELLRHQHRLVRARWLYTVADEFFTKQLPHNVTWALTMLYALDNAEKLGQLDRQGALVYDMRYLASVVINCFSSFGELLTMPKRFAEISGGVHRLAHVVHLLEGAAAATAHVQASARHTPSDGVVGLHTVTVTAPTGSSDLFARQLSFELPSGQNLLITGPNGCGKSSIIRLLSGLWPQLDGHVQAPEGALLVSDSTSTSGNKQLAAAAASVYYVAQKAFCPQGSLRAQVVYPLAEEAAMLREAGGNNEERLAALDKRISQLLSVVRLPYLQQREGLGGKRDNWSNVLSLGEQQRLGMARLFYHAPAFGVLDECTNATSADVEADMYRHARSLGISLITVTQRMALHEFHDLELRMLDGRGNWELRKVGATSTGSANSNTDGAADDTAKVIEV